VNQDENDRRLAEATKAINNADPEFLKKYGNPLNKNDPRHWLPSERGDRGVSLADRVKLLELDMDLMQITMGKVVHWVAEQQEKEILEELKRNPGKALEMLARATGQEVPEDLQKIFAGFRGPTDNGPLFAGSVKGAKPDELVITPQGTIRVDQIPGYRNDPEWLPSTDWVEMNCMCEGHISGRENNAIDNRFDSLIDPDGDNRGGMYP
jgi:hypothetical protein